MEVPQTTNLEAAKIAKEAGKTVIMDLGGKDEPLLPEMLSFVDYLSPNETELTKVFMEGVDSAESLIEKYQNISLLMKMGPEGSKLLKHG